MVSNGVLHAIAICRDCDWTEDWYITAQKEAKRHARKMKHIVDVEVGRWHVYGENK